jgi:hypothetical protein
MTKARLLELLDEAESVYAAIELTRDGLLYIPIAAGDVRAELEVAADFFDDAANYWVDWDEADCSLYIGERYIGSG